MARKPKEEVSEVQEYLDEISAYEREFKRWEGRVDKILKRYRDESRENKSTNNSKFNILWSNVQTLVPACFSKLPQPDVSRRFRDNDPVGRVASLILERALDFEVQHYTDYRTTMRQCVHDRFLGGRGTAWVRYEPHMKAMEDPINGVQITEDIDEVEIKEQLDYECVPVDYVHWKDFGHSVARTWEEVTKVWRKVYMDKEAVEDRFGKKIADKLAYDSSPENQKKAGRLAEETYKKQAIIYELWDKTDAKAVWISKSSKQVLDERDDPLELQDFFPCPKPLYATISNESLVPVPDFTLYQDQANELDNLADKIDGLVKALKVCGVYDASEPSLQRLFTEGENTTLIPVKNWAAFAEKNGLSGTIDLVDLKPIAEALQAAYEAMTQVKEQVYEITGISDIIRGQVDPREKLGQSEMKGQFASLRLRSMQEDVAFFATQLLQLKAQVMCLKFSPKTLATMAAVDQLTQEDQVHIQEAMALLVGQERLQNEEADAPNPLRSFRIEVSADTMVQLDEQAEKQDRMEMLQAFGSYIQMAGQAAMQAPQLIPLLMEVGKFGLTAFKVGKAIEGTFDNALDQLKKQAQQQMMQPKPQDPAVLAEQAKAQAAQQKAQLQVGVAKTKAQIDVQKMKAQQQHDQADLALEGQRMQMDAQRMDLEHQNAMRNSMIPQPVRKQ